VVNGLISAVPSFPTPVFRWVARTARHMNLISKYEVAHWHG
jgi:hypothetical protein